MYLMYVDECGDSGFQDGSSRYFILSAMIVHEAYWTDTMTQIHGLRKALRDKYGFPVAVELHAGEMLGRSSKKYSAIGKLDRMMIFRDVLSFESTLEKIRILNVVVDKNGKSFGFSAFETAWDTLINRFENTIRHGNFPSPYDGGGAPFSETGLLIVDETDEKKLRSLIRRMRHGNVIPSAIMPGSMIRHDLERVIEDPLHKQSEWSLPIQLCDANSYFLKQTLEPNSTIRRFKARNYFYKLEPVLLKEVCAANDYGIVFR